MSLKIWILFMIGFVIYIRSAAKLCVRRYVEGKWISKGDCGGPERKSEIQKEIHLRVENERKWTVFQRRMTGNIDFYRGWNDYVKGFGNREGDFWLGLAEMHEMTKEGNMELEINMIERATGIRLVAKYSNFRIGPGSDYYRLTLSGFSGNATSDTFSYHNNRRFTTKDADHDGWSKGNCAPGWEGGWWYGHCGHSNLNGNFKKSDVAGCWWHAPNPSSYRLLRYSEMKFSKRL